jgi:transcription elongation factor Elf1
MTSMPHEYRIGQTNKTAEENMICPHCGMDSGIQNNLSMTIPTEGLYCEKCGGIVVLPSITTIN